MEDGNDQDMQYWNYQQELLEQQYIEEQPNERSEGLHY